jgi:hypothetical protein
MKDQVKRFIIRHSFLEYALFAFYHIKNAKYVRLESERRKAVSLFDCDQLCDALPYGPFERVIDNNLYGHAYQIREYAGLKTDLKAYLEHGLFWGGMLHADEYHWHFKRVITFSSNRKRDIEEKLPTKRAVPIGPYIHYAKGVLDASSFVVLKKQLGKVLLVFPAHSVLNVEASFDVNLFLDEVERIKTAYDTVLVSLYFIDAKNLEARRVYEERGFRIVTSGHRYDLYFISRQRSLIELADMTMSNEVGTHVGNCIHLGKPHYIFQQKTERISQKKGELERHSSLFTTEEMNLVEIQKAEVLDVFSQFNDRGISALQRQIVDKYWGLSETKTAEELAELFG